VATPPGRTHAGLLSLPTRRSSDLVVDDVLVPATQVEGVVIVAIRHTPLGDGRPRRAADGLLHRAILRVQTVEAVVAAHGQLPDRSEEHTSELQSRENLVCRLLLEK